MSIATRSRGRFAGDAPDAVDGGVLRERAGALARALQLPGPRADIGGMSAMATDMRTVTLSAHELRLVRNLVERARMQSGVSDMRRVIELDRLSDALDHALDEQ